MRGGKAMNQQNGLEEIWSRGALIDEGEARAIGIEKLQHR
jgi:hypothetical protein